jgi:hypothetical protein
VAANDGREIKAAQVFTGNPCCLKLYGFRNDLFQCGDSVGFDPKEFQSQPWQRRCTVKLSCGKCIQIVFFVVHNLFKMLVHPLKVATFRRVLTKYRYSHSNALAFDIRGNKKKKKNHRCESVTFWNGSGPTDPYLGLMDPTPDPAIFFSDIQNGN